MHKCTCCKAHGKHKMPETKKKKHHEHETKKKMHREKVHKVMHEYKEGELHAGSKMGPIVRNPKQAIAIALSEARRGKKK